MDLLKQRIGDQIYIRLRNGSELDAKLMAYDEHVNLILQDVKIVMPGISDVEHKKLMYLRGDGVMLTGQR